MHESSSALLTQIGEAQVSFRGANEGIQASAHRLTIAGPIPFICECPDRDCTEVVSLTFDQYEAVRQHPRRFFNVTGHEQPSVDAGAERVVVVHAELTVVEKVGVAGSIADDAYRHLDRG